MNAFKLTCMNVQEKLLFYHWQRGMHLQNIKVLRESLHVMGKGCEFSCMWTGLVLNQLYAQIISQRNT